MVVNQWTGPWYHAPKFNQVLAPLTTVSLGVWAVLLVFAIEMGLQRTPTYTAGAAGALGVAWLVLMWRLRNLMLDGAAMGLALLAHGIFAGYVVSLVGTIWLLWLAISAGSWMVAAPSVVSVAPLVGLAWAGRRGEKYIAQRCIRQYLVEAVKPAESRQG
jgi:cellobiose-specific phosphotransferase system component IIC